MMDTTFIIRFLKEAQDIMCEHRDYLIELDSIVGDGDLGLTMSDGFTAGYKKAVEEQPKDIGRLLYIAGKAISTAVPSTMGTLMASGLMEAGKKLKGKEVLENADIVTLFQSYFEGVMNRGKAKVGEKTFLDGLHPAILALAEALEQGVPLDEAATKAREAAELGFEHTTTMIAVHGRAATRGEASRELRDPGAAVAVLLMKAFEKSFKRHF